MMRPALILLSTLPFFAMIPSCGGLEDQEVQLLEAYKNRAQIYYEAKRFESCRQQAARGLAIDPEDPMLNHTFGRALLEMRSLGKIVDARPFLEKAYALDPNYRTAFSLAEFHQRYGVYLRDDSLSIQQAIRAYPESDPNRREEMRVQHLKQDAIAFEHWQEALVLLDVALLEAPEFLQGLQMAAMTHSLMGHDEIALEQLNRILEILLESKTYKNRELATNTSLNLAQEQKLRADLLEDMQHEISVRHARAAIFKRQGNPQAEQSEYRFVLRLNPESAEAYFGLGMSLYEQGKRVDALGHLKSFVRVSNLEQDSKYMQQALRILTETND
ncbi:MAG: tetratricopeptide repeat protein [Planctomycetes bacterium]|jgi:tetratricopeptide (TPR) repeat protein|nr:tetratricopeptide repeat protein [Planctomycetota bacterium]MBT4559431.1 tetratricopeptide repeat protein [Planctomycetota bacterium]MBT5119438.1 tetratricopeptide repeat protein [Planctomycetota bacterium]MBT7013057.1 tetratricopeptide repeat protein [Planctomycetota bacterium]MBT7319042.1 tetratricopeptide repeat protein [Planctomycetota bacterium]